MTNTIMDGQIYSQHVQYCQTGQPWHLHARKLPPNSVWSPVRMWIAQNIQSCHPMHSNVSLPLSSSPAVFRAHQPFSWSFKPQPLPALIRQLPLAYQPHRFKFVPIFWLVVMFEPHLVVICGSCSFWLMSLVMLVIFLIHRVADKIQTQTYAW